MIVIGIMHCNQIRELPFLHDGVMMRLEGTLSQYINVWGHHLEKNPSYNILNGTQHIPRAKYTLNWTTLTGGPTEVNKVVILYHCRDGQNSIMGSLFITMLSLFGWILVPRFKLEKGLRFSFTSKHHICLINKKSMKYTRYTKLLISGSIVTWRWCRESILFTSSTRRSNVSHPQLSNFWMCFKDPSCVHSASTRT